MGVGMIDDETVGEYTIIYRLLMPQEIHTLIKIVNVSNTSPVAPTVDDATNNNTTAPAATGDRRYPNTRQS